MKLIKSLLILLVLLWIPLNSAHAAIQIIQEPNPIFSDTQQIKFTFTSDRDDFQPSEEYTFNVAWSEPAIGINNFNNFARPINERAIEFTIDGKNLRAGEWNFELCRGRSIIFSVCNDATKVISGSFTVFKSSTRAAIAMDQYKFRAQTVQPVYILNALPEMEYRFWFEGENTVFTPPLFTGKFSQNQIGPSQYHERTAMARINVGDASPRTKTLCMTYSTFFFGANAGTLTCDHKISGIAVTTTTPQDSGGSVVSNETTTPTPVAPVIKDVKYDIPPPPCDVNAKTCPTAFGNISTDPAGFIRSIFTILLSLAGGIALLLIIVSGYRLMTSQGNPERVQGAREQLTSAIVGLLFIIFSLSILTIIGVDILRIPGFTR